MNAKLVEDIANAVLYEGYMLYPYRPSSVKNRQRWNFGVVYPRSYSEMQGGPDNCSMQTECLATISNSANINVKVRFLQAVARTIGEFDPPVDELPAEKPGVDAAGFHLVESLEFGGKILQAWQEAIECDIVLPPISVSNGGDARHLLRRQFPGGCEVEPLRGANGRISGLIMRTKEPISVEVDALVKYLSDGLYKITVRISNSTVVTSQQAAPQSFANRDAALMQSLLSAHTILSIEGGQFVSLIDPPASLKEIAAGCNNIGTWPVLVGEEGQLDDILSSPIILYDYPQIAPQSPGDLFDGTEIDEILALRILTLTESEKNEMRHADERARQILERTEAMPVEHFMKLHGVLRGVRPAEEGN